MALQRVYAIFFALLGAVSIVDAARIAYQAREGANFDAIGPDRYLLVLGVLMLAAGVWCLIHPEQIGLPLSGKRGAPAVPMTSRLLITLAMLAGFAALTPVVGFSIACVAFLALELRLLSGWPWWKVAILAAGIALAFHVLFVRLADMPLPKGAIWDW
jgi:hypothetical protein